MKKFTAKLLPIILILIFAFSFVGCEDFVISFGSNRLDKPVVTIDEDGIASWNAIQFAKEYGYKIDDGEEVITTATSIKLFPDESIVVRAKGDGTNHKDSPYSKKQTYTASQSSLSVLESPVVSVDKNGIASWENVKNASGYIVKINDEDEQETTETSVVLNVGDTIQVKAKGDGITFADSFYSKLKTYTLKNEDHYDLNGDNICDDCGMEMVVKIDFYGINDQHGVFCDADGNPGLDELTTYMKNAYADPSSYEILVSAGDMWQGTAESSLNKGAMMTEWMNDIGFSAMALGNHEFDWGSSFILENSKKAEFPILGINVTDREMTDDVYCHPSTVVERGGVKIGIIGAIGNCLSSISGEFTYSGNLNFAVKNALTTLVKNESTRLRNEEGCEFIVYLLHDGYFDGGNYELSKNEFLDDYRTDLANIYYDTELSNGYIDLVFEGHTHQNYIITDEYGVKHIQSGGNNNYLGFASVTFDRVEGTISIDNVGKINNSTYGNSSIKDDPIIQELYDKYFPDPENDPYTKIIGYNIKTRYSTEVLQNVASLYYQRGAEVWGDKYDIVLAGGFMSARVSSIPRGNVTYSSLYKMLPFDNALVLGKISGEKLKSQFINSTNSRYYIDYGGKTVNVNEISNSASYYIVTDTYSAYYRYNGITPVDVLRDNIYARDLLKEFISNGNWS